MSDDSDPNIRAFTRVAERLVRQLPFIVGISVLLIILIAAGAGSAMSSRQGTPGWGSLFFIFGASHSLATVIPIFLCIVLILLFIYGVILFVIYRFRKDNAA
jgi:hypothetical protein